MKAKTPNQSTRTEVHPALLQYFVEASFEVLSKGLYLGVEFDTASTLHIKALLMRYFKRIPPEKFQERIGGQLATLCNKVSLARELALSHEGCYVPHPCIWVQKALLKQRPEACSCSNCDCLTNTSEYQPDELLIQEVYGSLRYFITPVKF